MPTMHEIDYKVYGDDLQFVEIELDPPGPTHEKSGCLGGWRWILVRWGGRPEAYA